MENLKQKFFPIGASKLIMKKRLGGLFEKKPPFIPVSKNVIVILHLYQVHVFFFFLLGFPSSLHPQLFLIT